ncbi:methionine sulfoxide reductase B [Ventosimonas gracilis]|uniref:Peptide methionine sulfoxide reductase MsrB n=1 Tax=Ventosimonas gracilis TaxID=1680762 RepID=A0A139SUR5_9GAMM|nr:peptide-methionine (R)-S-oxide reductase MsrB [Ventosimonas gracilis]KXU38348.1 methionine sulfoxide reductase B [Ventosimonas gracilis]
MLTRRFILFSGAACLAGGTGLLSLLSKTAWQAHAASGNFPFALDDDEWRKRLTAQQYAILRRHGTERPYSSALNNEKRRGIFVCAGCEKELFSSTTKYDSRTGWPSFWMPISKEAVGESRDTSYGMVRTEIHCAYCGGHLGHVFNDGPPPTGLRYCMNGDAMLFKPFDS